jgi:FtsH-binding integral membrane protein
MDQPSLRPLYKPNPKTRSAHRKETFWQIVFPLLVAILVIAAIVAAIVINGVGTASVWADIALIVLIIPAMVIMIFPLIIIVLLIVGSSKMLAIIPGYAHQVQIFFRRIRMRATEYSDIAVKPVIDLLSISTLSKKKHHDDEHIEIQEPELH